MVALAAYRPDVYTRLASLVDPLLHQSHPSSTHTPGERELVATHFSSLNDCAYCSSAHDNVAAAHLQDPNLVENVTTDFESSEVSPQMKALLRIARLVQRSGKGVTLEAVEEAKKQGASDMDVHHTVLIAAAFCMFNRYVGGLGTGMMPGNMAAFAGRGASNCSPADEVGNG